MDKLPQKYQAFLKTVETKSFTKAAEHLGCSQSAISRQISALESSWHLTLLERNRAGVNLTAEGSRLFPKIKAVCDAEEQLKNEVDDLNNLDSGIIRIGTFSSVATHWLPNIIRRFQKDYPNIDYEMRIGHYADIEKWILEGRVDCGFIRIPVSSNLDVQLMHRDMLKVVLPENHPLAGFDAVPIHSLAEYPFMLLEKDEKAEISELLEKYHVKAKIHFQTLDDYAVMSMVESGLGISILPELILKRIPYRLIVKDLNVEAYRDIGIAARNFESVPLAVKRFIKYLPYRDKK